MRPELRATGYGIMNLVSISCGGLADWGFGALRDRQVPLNVIFGAFAGAAIVVHRARAADPAQAVTSLTQDQSQMTMKLHGLVAATHTPFTRTAS